MAATFAPLAVAPAAVPRTCLPTAADVFCVVEVADSSLERDREGKLPIYARAGVPQYIIVNLRNRTAEAYTDPDPAAGTHPPPVVIAGDGTLALQVGAGAAQMIRLADALP